MGSVKELDQGEGEELAGDARLDQADAGRDERDLDVQAPPWIRGTATVIS